MRRLTLLCGALLIAAVLFVPTAAIAKGDGVAGDAVTAHMAAPANEVALCGDGPVRRLLRGAAQRWRARWQFIFGC